jgi:hypothetical protein
LTVAQIVESLLVTIVPFGETSGSLPQSTDIRA